MLLLLCLLSLYRSDQLLRGGMIRCVLPSGLAQTPRVARAGDTGRFPGECGC